MSVTFIKKAKVSVVMIDKLSIVLDVAHKQQWDIENNLKTLLPEYGVPVYRPRYCFSARLYLEYPDVYVEISIYPKLKNCPFFRVELNPAHGYLADFKMLMDKILPKGYVQLIAGGRCTRIDAAIDVKGVDINTLLITYPKMRKTKGYYNNGKLETYTLGVKQGKTEICVYDKVSQLISINEKSESHNPIQDDLVTRIEVRKKEGYLLKDLAKLPNFFDGILIAGYSHEPQEDGEKFRLFLEACRSRGAQDALKMLSEPTRKRYHQLLQNCKLKWWEPKEIWKSWHIPANALLNPTHFGK